jgi:hypothetical protein
MENKMDKLAVISTLRKQGILSSVGSDSPITEDEVDRFLEACLSEKCFMDQNAGEVLLATTLSMTGKKLNTQDIKDRGMVLISMVENGVLNSEVLQIAIKILSVQRIEENTSTGVVRPSTNLFPKSSPELHYSGPPNSNWAIASLIFSLLSFCAFSIILSIPSVVFGIIALVSIKQSNGKTKGNGFAWAGIILGSVNIIMTLLFLAIVIISSLLTK